MNDDAGIGDILLHICDGQGAFLLTQSGSILSCKYDNVRVEFSFQSFSQYNG